MEDYLAGHCIPSDLKCPEHSRLVLNKYSLKDGKRKAGEDGTPGSTILPLFLGM